MYQLDESNFIVYAMRHYENPQCTTIDEFNDDCKKFKYLRVLFGKLANRNELKERLILNHLIILYNVFEADACTNMLRFKLSKHETALKPFLLYLHRWPPEETDIAMNTQIIDALRSI
jgi:hypothetical protein